MHYFKEIALYNKNAFRHPFTAGEGGIVDMTAQLSVDYVLMAYRWGIFPWVNDSGFFLWFFISPRLVLYPENLHVQKSMRPYFNQQKFQCTFDREFEEVIRNCKNVERKEESDTWIDEDFIDTYTTLHEMGYAHSVEVWDGEEMVGGLYGIAIGKVFYGESMFTRESNASKFGFIKLVRLLKEKGFELIDCQQDTPHMRSFGADTISGGDFLSALRQNMLRDDNEGKWN